MIEIIAIIVAELCYADPQKDACERHFAECMLEGGAPSIDLVETCTEETFTYLRGDAHE